MLSERQSFRVIEDRGDRQVVEVNDLDTHQSWSRYEAYRDRVVPIAFRTDGGPFFIGMIGFVAAIAAAWIRAADLLAGGEPDRSARRRAVMPVPEAGDWDDAHAAGCRPRRRTESGRHGQSLRQFVGCRPCKV